MHSAPLGIHARGHIVLVDVTAHEEFYRHDPEQAGEGRDQAEQVQEEAGDDKLPQAGGGEKGSDVGEVQGDEKDDQARGIQKYCEEDLQGGEVSDGEYLRRDLIVLDAVLTASQRAGSNLGGPPERSRTARHFSRSVAVTQERPDRHLPSRSL